MQLALYSDRFTLYGRPLVLYGSTPAPGPIVPAPNYNYMPPIRLDRHGKRIDEKALKRRTIKAVEPEDKPEVKQALKRIEPESTTDPDVLDQMAAEALAIAALLPAIEAALIAEWQAIAAQLAWYAEDERDVEILLLAM